MEAGMSRRNFLLPAFLNALAAMLPAFACNAGDAPSERDEGPGASFFGQAKEAGTLRSIEHVQVKAELGVRRIIVQTNADGQFKLRPNFGSDVASDSITVSCAKEGYETLDVSRRRMSSAADAPVEINCLLAPQK
jgi:hypothetical protein